MSRVSRARVAASVERYWADQVELMRSLPDDLAQRQADAVHDLRAAGRRLRATIRIYRPLLHQKQAVRLLDELSHYNDVLGRARDAEVATQHVAEVLDAVPEGSELAGARDLIDRLRQEQERTARTAEEMVHSPAATALVDALATFCTDPWRKSVGRGGRGPGRSRILKRVAWAESRAMAVWEQLDGAGLVSPTLAPTRHRLRRRIKAARYAHESLTDTVKGAAQRAEAFARASDVLGQMQDAVVLEGVLAADGGEAARTVLAVLRERSEQAAGRATAIIGEALS